MSYFLYILSHILLPIFLVAGIAFFVQKRLHLHIGSLTKVQLYIMMPALMFYNVYFNELSGDKLMTVVGFIVLMFVLLIALSTLLGRVLHLPLPEAKALVNASTLTNMSNYGLPLFMLLYAGPRMEEAVSIQLIVILTTSLLINTIGLYNASSGSYTGKAALKNIFRIPLIPVIVLAFVLRALHLPLWEPLVSTLSILKAGVVPMALFILGMQLAETEIRRMHPHVVMTGALKLLIAPFLAFLLVTLWGLEGMLAQMLIISASFPTAVNSVLLAIEFDGDKEFASQTVLFSTLLSAITVTAIIGWVMTNI